MIWFMLGPVANTHQIVIISPKEKAPRRVLFRLAGASNPVPYHTFRDAPFLSTASGSIRYVSIPSAPMRPLHCAPIHAFSVPSSASTPRLSGSLPSSPMRSIASNRPAPKDQPLHHAWMESRRSRTPWIRLSTWSSICKALAISLARRSEDAARANSSTSNSRACSESLRTEVSAT